MEAHCAINIIRCLKSKLFLIKEQFEIYVCYNTETCRQNRTTSVQILALEDNITPCALENIIDNVLLRNF